MHCNGRGGDSFVEKATRASEYNVLYTGSDELDILDEIELMSARAAYRTYLCVCLSGVPGRSIASLGFVIESFHICLLGR